MGAHDSRMANRIAEPVAVDQWPPGVPVQFGRLAGWLHPGRSTRAVLMVGADGFEGLCTHQSWRAMASMIAALGPSALRFDLPGEGDSLDPAEGSDLLGERMRAIQAAASFLRHELGFKDICVVGLRFGALLALKSLSEEGSSVSKAALLAPPASGRAYVRELKAAARLMAAQKPGCGVSDSGINLCGFNTEPALADAMSGLVFDPTHVQDGTKALLVCPDAEDADSLRTRLFRDASAVETMPFDGYEALMAGPTLSRTPWDVLERTARWLAEGAEGPGDAPIPTTPKGLDGEGVRERRILFGPDNELAGVLCEPTRASPNLSPVIFPNAGANNHAGWGRMNVDLARRLALRGVASLRYDAAGVGDSVCMRSGPRPLLYSERHRLDLIRAVDALSACGRESPIVVGLCAGAFNGLHAIHRDRRIPRAVLVNMLRMIWHPHNDLDVEEARTLQSTDIYAAKALQGGQWKRLFSGEITVSRAVQIAALLGARFSRGALGRLGLDTGIGDDTRRVRTMIRETIARRARIDFVYAEKDAGRDEFVRHLGDEKQAVLRYPGISFSILKDSDHELTPEAARQALFDLILTACTETPARGAAR